MLRSRSSGNIPSAFQSVSPAVASVSGVLVGVVVVFLVLAASSGSVVAAPVADGETVVSAGEDAGVTADGGAAAAERRGFDVEDANETLDDGGIYWQGQAIELANGTTNRSAETLLLREYDTRDGEPSRVVREVEFDDGEALLRTDNLDGTYVMVPADRRDTAITFRSGTATGTVDVGNATPFEVLVQTLDVEWEQSRSDTVRTDLRLEIESNRARYNVKVSGPALTFAELEAAFMGSRLLRDHNGPFDDRQPAGGRHRAYDAYADDDGIVLRGFGDGALRPDFGDLEAIPGAISVAVTDTDAEDTAELSAGSVETGPLSITELTVPEAVDPGDQVALSARVRNDRADATTETIEFALGDDARASVRVTVPPGESTAVSATLPAPTDPGDAAYDVSVRGDSVTGSVSVAEAAEANPPRDETEDSVVDEEASDGDDRETETDDDGMLNLSVEIQAGAGVLVALISGGAYALWRRR